MATQANRQRVGAGIGRAGAIAALVSLICVLIAWNRLPFDITADPATPACILLLASFSIAGVVVGIDLARRSRRVFNSRSLLTWSYVAVGPLFGVVHLSSLPGDQRGYFDALTTGAPGSLAAATIVTIGGLVALGIRLVAPPIDAKRRRHAPIIPYRSIVLLLLASVVVVVVGAYSASVIRAYIASTGADRIIALDTGLARFSYFSNWLVWGVSLAALVYCARRGAVSRLQSAIVLSAAVVLIVASLSWTGGRTIIGVMALPLGLVSLPLIYGYRAAFAFLTTVGRAIYIAIITIARTGNTALGSSSILDFIDWQWGRLSMSAWAFSYTAEHGLLWSEAFLSSGSSFLFGALRLVGVPIRNLPALRSSQVAGKDVLHSTTQIYIVPRLNAEFILNLDRSE